MTKQLIVLTITMFFTTIALSQMERKDTNFLVREIGEEYYHAIFKETHKRSKFYDIISNNLYNPWDSSTYAEGISLLKQFNIIPKKNRLPNISREWRPLYLFRGNYYVYAPGDWGNHSWVSINDSTFVAYVFGDGTQPSVINSFKSINQNQFQIQLASIGKKFRIINVYFIDRSRQIAVFEDLSIKGIDRFFLMVAAEKVPLFPIIVNYCKDQKCFEEFSFDKPDYKNLLKKFSSKKKKKL